MESNICSPKIAFFSFDTSFQYFANQNLLRYYEANIEYDWTIAGKPRIIKSCHLDLEHYMGALLPPKDTSDLINDVGKIKEELGKIRAAIEQSHK
jgi:hypothetical protein